MKRMQQILFITLGALFLLVCSVISTPAQPGNPTDPPRPRERKPPPITGNSILKGPKISDPQSNTITGQIRWKKEMGVPSYPNYDTPCARFQMSVTETVAGAPGTLGSEWLHGWQINSEMGESGNYYFCTFKVNGVPFGVKYNIIAKFRHEALGESVDSTTWTGGSQSQAPPPAISV